jgi:PKD repeat protein
MKKQVLLTAIAIMTFLGLNAQTVNVTGNITTNTTWTKNNIYILSPGFKYVTNNATLTIEPGTIIKGNEGTLVITRGSKIMAEGTANQPIVFTSNQPAGSRAPGDWGGIIICGRAPINDPAGERLAEGGIDPVLGLYGGTDILDNSGVLRYVRIEYAGVAYQPNNETNSLTMGGVGVGTTIDHVQVSYGGDDGFEWFGGNVNAKYLIVQGTVDDMYDVDYGYTGKVQFALGIADTLLADISGSNGVETDNDATGTTNGPLTKGIFSNMTLVGPMQNSTTTFNSNYKRALHIRRSSSFCTYNSIFTGWPVGLKIDGQTTANNATNGSLQFKNNIIAGSTQPLDSTGLTFGMANWFAANGNSVLPTVSNVMMQNTANYQNPSYLLNAGSPALSGASFTAPNLQGNFFTPTTYVGAFDGTNDWTDCWANFDAQNTSYNTPNYGLSANGSYTANDLDVTFTNTSNGASSYSWNFGDGSAASTVAAPSHTFATPGDYTVVLQAINGTCVAEFSFVVSVGYAGIEEKGMISAISLFPNPANESVNIALQSKEATNVDIVVTDNSGKIVSMSSNVQVAQGDNTLSIDTFNLASGLYNVSVISENNAHNIKLAIRK